MVPDHGRVGTMQVQTIMPPPIFLIAKQKRLNSRRLWLFTASAQGFPKSEVSKRGWRTGGVGAGTSLP